MAIRSRATPSTVKTGIDGRQAWLQLAISVVLSVVGSVGLWSVVVFLPAIQAEFGVDRASASLPYTLTMMGFAAGNVIMGRYVDKVGIRLPIVFAAIVLGLGFMLASLSTALWQFAIIQGLMIGVGTSATFGPLMANISHWFLRRRGLAVAAVASGNYLAGTLWPPIVQSISATEGWRATHVGIGLFCIIVMIPLARYLLPNPGHTGQNGGPAADLIPIDLSPRALQTLLAMAGIGCCIAMAMPQVHIVAYSADLGFGVARGAEMLSLMLAGGVVSRLASGVLADRIGGVKTLLAGSVLQAFALLLYLPFDGLLSLYIVSFVFGLAQGGIVPSYAIIVREYLPAREAGQRVGLIIMATVIGMAFGGWISGWIYDLTQSYQAAFLNGFAFNIFNITVMTMILWRSRTVEANA